MSAVADRPGRRVGIARRTVATSSLDERRLALGIAGLVGLALWLPALRWSLTIDELLSAWVTRDGLGDAVSRAQEFQGNSPLYFGLLWTWRQVAGDGEVLLRLPSTIAVAVAAYHLVRFGRELGLRLAGPVGVLVFVGSLNVTVRATTARPYGLLLACTVVSARYAWRWLATARWRDGVVGAVALAATAYCTPFAGLLVVAHAVGVADARRRGTLTPVHRAGRLTALTVVLAVPLVPQFLMLASRTSELVSVDTPTLIGALSEAVPATLVVALLAGLVRGGVVGRFGDHAPALRYLATWAFAPAVGLYVAGTLSGSSLWVPRYWVVGVPGLALLVGAVADHLAVAGRQLAVVLLCVFSIVGVAQGLRGTREGWREAFAWASARVAPGEDAVLLLHSTLVESAVVERLEDPAWRPYLTAMADYYRIGLPVVPLPDARSPEALAYVDRVVADAMRSRRVIVLLNRGSWPGAAAGDYPALLRPRLAAAGYAVERSPDHGLSQVAVYRRR